MANTEYITRDGDRLDLITWQAYGDAFAWGVILAANPSLPIAASYPAGLKLIIPVMGPDTVRELDQLPPWKTATT